MNHGVLVSAITPWVAFESQDRCIDGFRIVSQGGL
jgi:hypothetical protein